MTVEGRERKIPYQKKKKEKKERQKKEKSRRREIGTDRLDFRKANEKSLC